MLPVKWAVIQHPITGKATVIRKGSNMASIQTNLLGVTILFNLKGAGRNCGKTGTIVNVFIPNATVGEISITEPEYTILVEDTHKLVNVYARAFTIPPLPLSAT